jgi:hypothetical protein
MARASGTETGHDVTMSDSGKIGRSTSVGAAEGATTHEASASQAAAGRKTLTESLPAVEAPAFERSARESPAGASTEGSQIEPDVGAGAAGAGGAAAGGPQTIDAQTTIPGAGRGSGESAPAREAGQEAGGREVEANATVAPGGSPTLGSGANDCLPSTASAVLAWEVVDAGTTWRVNVTSLTLSGRIRINPWPSKPTAMTVPNTPNPVDGGNIGNTAGPNYWQTVIDDLSNYDTSGGGAGPNWHDTAASNAHEWAHWNQDYVGDSVTSSAGGNWSAVNARIDALTVPKAGNADATAARAALTPLVNAEMATWRSATIRRWNALGASDVPGGGGRGYAAGAAVLARHIAAIKAYKTSKGWAATAPAPTTPAPAGSTPTPTGSRS